MDNMNSEMSMQLRDAYEKWMELQIKSCKGERRLRLQKGLSFSSKKFITHVIWPAVGSLDGWFAEYEVMDFKDGVRYLDLAKPLPFLKICIEADDKGTHGRNAESYKFSDDRFRQNDLVIDDWKVLRFSLQSILEQPRRCQQQLMHALAKWGIESDGAKPHLSPTELAIFKFIENKTVSFSPITIAQAVGIHRNTAARHLKSLVEKGKVIPDVTSGGPIRRYRSNKCS